MYIRHGVCIEPRNELHGTIRVSVEHEDGAPPIKGMTSSITCLCRLTLTFLEKNLLPFLQCLK